MPGNPMRLIYSYLHFTDEKSKVTPLFIGHTGNKRECPKLAHLTPEPTHTTFWTKHMTLEKCERQVLGQKTSTKLA